MARYWGPKSTRVYDSLCPELRELCDFVLAEVCDVALTCGHRDESSQNSLFPAFTKVKWPDSKHNKYPSEAVDMQPFPYPSHEGELREQMSYIAGRVIEWAKWNHIIVRWGGDWNQNNDVTDNGFDDLFHFEVLRAQNSRDLDSR